MDLLGREEGSRPAVSRPISVSAAFTGTAEIAEARDLVRSFLAGVQAVHGPLLSPRAKDMVQLVVSELVTNARKYASGPCQLTLEVSGDAVEVTVRDSEPRLPVVLAPDPSRVGQHGLEIVVAVCRSFEIHREPVGKRITAAVIVTGTPVGDAGDDQSG